MPVVPRYDQPTAESNALPMAQFNAPQAKNFAIEEGQQAMAGLQKMGSVGSVLANDMMQRANQVQVDYALNQVKEEQLRLTYDKDVGYINQKGLAAIKRDSGKPIEDEYGDTLKQRIEQISAGLGNDTQRQAFAQNANGVLTSFRGSAMVHRNNEFKHHSISTSEGVIKTAVDEIRLRYREPDAVELAVQRIEAHSFQKAKLTGDSGEESSAYAKEMISLGYKTAVMSALEGNDPEYALEFFQRGMKSGRITGDDAFALRGQITKEVDQKVAFVASDQTIARHMPKLIGSPVETLAAITMQSESGGRRFGKDGALLESPKGAKGEMQVMDKTNLDPGFGVKPAQNNGPDERARVGRDYLQAMLQRYEGDPAKMWAAYNAGPGALDKALAAEAKNKGLGIRGDLASKDPSIVRTWLDYMPDETQKYVSKNLAALDKAQKGGVPVARPSLQDLHQDLMKNPALAESPERLKIAMAQVSHRYADIDKAIKQRGDELETQVQQALLSNGGRYNELPANLRMQVAQTIPGKADELMRYGESVGGKVVTDPEVYAELRSLSAIDPAKFASTNLTPFYNRLSPEHRKQFIDMQADMRDPAKRAQSATVVQQLGVAHGLMGWGDSDKKKRAEFDLAVHQDIDAAIALNGGKDIGFDQRKTIISKHMLLQNTTWRGEVVIPDADRTQITERLASLGAKVTENNIRAMFNKRYGIN